MTDYLPPEASYGEGKTTAPAAPTAVPHSREAEEAVIGAVFINPEVYYDVAQFLSADDFYIHRHRWIWDAFTGLHEQRIPIDLLTVADELDRKGQLGEVGGPAYLTSLINQVPSSLNAESYGRIVDKDAGFTVPQTISYQFAQGREAVKRRAVTTALVMLRQALLEYHGEALA